jgi:hypothetical protein
VGVPGRGGRRVKRTGCAGLDLRFAGACFGLSSPDGQRHLGEAVLGSLTRKGGAVVLNVASEGSTDTISFNVRVEKSGGGDIPRSILTFERIADDDCKALLNGADPVFGLEKDMDSRDGTLSRRPTGSAWEKQRR